MLITQSKNSIPDVSIATCHTMRWIPRVSPVYKGSRYPAVPLKRRKPAPQNTNSGFFFFYLFILSFSTLVFASSMAGFEHQVKERAKELKVLFKKGVKIVGDSCKKGWHKVKNIRR
ncbi:hypothetical protein SLE2022_050200 [Rubroshorea leprosula]